MVATKPMTLDQFLELPETEPPSEFVCGRIVEKPMPTWFHSRIAARLAALLEMYLMEHDEGYVNVELRHAARAEARAYVPDLSVTRWERAPSTLAERREGAIETTPDLAVEIVSPDDRPGRVADKLAFYLRAGVPLVWIIDPDDRTVSIYRPTEQVRVLSEADTLDAAPVLASFSLQLAGLFGVLSERARD